MKVLHINSYYSGSNFYKNLYDKQIENGCEIEVYVPVTFSNQSSRLNLGKYTTVSANHGKYDRFLYYLKHNKIYKDLLQKYKIEEYSLIHAHSLFSNGYIAWKLKQQFGVPFIVAVRNTDVNTFFKYMIHLRKIGIKILEEASQVIFLSESYKKQVIENYVPNNLKNEILNKSKVIPNGIDDFWFENKAVLKEKKHDDIHLLYIGAVNKNKNLLTTMKALDLLKERGISITYTIVGKIEDESIFRRLESSPFVTYLEPRKKEELITIYRLSDIFVMPSIHETFGLVYAEAMSQGLPIIYSKGQGFDEQFEEGLVGFHVNSTNEKEIAERILDIITNYNSISANAIFNVEKFNWNNIVSEYKKAYLEVSEL